MFLFIFWQILYHTNPFFLYDWLILLDLGGLQRSASIGPCHTLHAVPRPMAYLLHGSSPGCFGPTLTSFPQLGSVSARDLWDSILVHSKNMSWPSWLVVFDFWHNMGIFFILYNSSQARRCARGIQCGGHHSFSCRVLSLASIPSPATALISLFHMNIYAYIVVVTCRELWSVCRK